MQNNGQFALKSACFCRHLEHNSSILSDGNVFQNLYRKVRHILRDKELFRKSKGSGDNYTTTKLYMRTSNLYIQEWTMIFRTICEVYRKQTTMVFRTYTNTVEQSRMVFRTHANVKKNNNGFRT